MDSKRTVLVVDDEPGVVKVIKLHLEKMGYEVHTATDGEEGLRRAYEINPGLILLDVNMPKKGGIEFFDDLVTGNGKKTFPILVLTGRKEFESLFKGMDADGFISKPIDFKKLAQMVDDIFHKYGKSTPKRTACSVCVVEDNDAAAESLAMNFIRAGFSVRCVKAAGELAAQSFTHPLDLLVVKLSLCDVVSGLLKIPNLIKSGTSVMFYTDNSSELNKEIARKLCEEAGVSLLGLLGSGDASDVVVRAKEKLGWV